MLRKTRATRHCKGIPGDVAQAPGVHGGVHLRVRVGAAIQAGQQQRRCEGHCSVRWVAAPTRRQGAHARQGRHGAPRHARTSGAREQAPARACKWRRGGLGWPQRGTPPL
jgi:hypothetical protein